jgi:hypothetical protein
MFKLLPAVLLLLPFLLISAAAQSKSNAAISKQIKKLNIEKSVSLSFDGNTSKIMAVSENFGDREVSRAGAQAMNFAIGFFYPGDELKESPDPVLMTFWVLTKKPRFAEIHNVTFLGGGESVVYDNIRYAAKAREDMEYINCKITRADLRKMIANPDARVRLGDAEFRLSPQQVKLISEVLEISETGAEN